MLGLAGVVTGHWLVTGLVLRDDGLATASPLTGSPRSPPLTWFLQTLGPSWLAGVLPVFSPLHRGVRAAVSRSPWWTLAPVALLAVPDLGRFAAGEPGPDALQALTCWSVPHALGVADARGFLDRVRAGGSLRGAGTVTVVVLVAGAGYPASAVGVPGHPRSTLDPPNLVAPGLAGAQVGASLLLRPALTRVAVLGATAPLALARARFTAPGPPCGSPGGSGRAPAGRRG